MAVTASIHLAVTTVIALRATPDQIVALILMNVRTILVLLLVTVLMKLQTILVAVKVDMLEESRFLTLQFQPC